jgi:hypothetical protein
MKTKPEARKAFAMLIAFSLTLLFVNVFIHPGFAQQARLYIDPTPKTINEGTPIYTLFNVTVWVADVTALAGAQVHLEFNRNILKIHKWYEPTSDTQYVFYSKTTSALPPPPDVSYRNLTGSTEIGVAEISVSLFPTPPDQASFNGTGKICIFEFNITATSPPVLTSALSLQSSPNSGGHTYLLDPDGVTEIPVTLQDGYYQFIPEFAPLLVLSVLAASTAAILLLRRKRFIQKLDRV